MVGGSRGARKPGSATGLLGRTGAEKRQIRTGSQVVLPPRERQSSRMAEAKECAALAGTAQADTRG